MRATDLDVAVHVAGPDITDADLAASTPTGPADGVTANYPVC